ncbi:MAG: CHRD domain-containing protein [Gammaproteobacteria bacterium]
MQEKERGSISPCRSQLGPSDGGDRMNIISHKSRFTFAVIITLVAWSLVLIAGPAMAASVKVTLSGDQEVPPVKTSASGSGTITVGADKSVSGSITISGIKATAAHIHIGAPGHGGLPVLPLEKTADNVWSVPAGAKFTGAQYDDFKAGYLYINVHSEAHKEGEIRGQVNP